FDLLKAKSGMVLDEAAQALADLASDLELEEWAEQETAEVPNENGNDEPLDPWVDFHEGLSEEERTELDQTIQPVRSMLVKLHKIVFALKNSTTILLPIWYKTVKAHHLPQQMMPHDVATQWNSTFNMMDFALNYCPVID
ncbi:hypothetical protein CPB84DRAFT_1619821, partial [Gymnopilus junonius]